MDKLSAIYNVALQKEAGILKTISKPVKKIFNKANNLQLKAYMKVTNNPIARKIISAPSNSRFPIANQLGNFIGSSSSNGIGGGGMFGGGGASGLW